MKRTPMKRTAWLRAASTTVKSERNRSERLADRAQRAIKSAVLSTKLKGGPYQVAAPAGIASAAIKNEATASTTSARPLPKPKAHRNGHLRDMARGMPCLLQVPGVCCHDRSTVVCCHSNLSIHGKAGARKADDHYSVWGCAACHSWLDRGPAPKAEKYSAFMTAHLRQVREWRAVAFDPARAPRDRNAALWALGRLNSIPNQSQSQSA